MKDKPLISLFGIDALVLSLAISCGGGGGGSSGGSTSTATGTTTTTTTVPQQGVKSGELSNDNDTKKVFVRPNSNATISIVNPTCYTGSPEFGWEKNAITLSGVNSQSMIVGKSYIGSNIGGKINCTGGSLSLAPVYINAGDQYAIDELNNLLQKPVDKSGYGLTMERTGYAFENPLTREKINVLENSSPEIWGSINNPKGNFSIAFYESLDQKVVNATVNGIGCLKDAQGSYNANDCTTVQKIIDFMSGQGVTDVYFWPTVGKNFTELNKKATDDLKAGNLISSLGRKSNALYAKSKTSIPEMNNPVNYTHQKNYNHNFAKRA